MDRFPCTACGLCCTKAGSVDQLKIFALSNGTCQFLNEHNKCSIYETRPNLCRVDEMYSSQFSMQYSKVDFYRLNAKICNELQEQNNLDPVFRIEIK